MSESNSTESMVSAKACSHTGHEVEQLKGESTVGCQEYHQYNLQYTNL
jgi:hypothetical protein